MRSYLRTIQEREALGQFIKAGWSPQELAEFARDTFLAPGRAYPTATSYRYAIAKGADHPYAVETLATMRAPGYVMPAFDRPVPKRYAWDDPDNPEHTPEMKADVVIIAQLMRARDATRRNLPLPDPDEPIPRSLWRRCYRIRNRYHSLEDTIEIQGLRGDDPSREPEAAPPSEPALDHTDSFPKGRRAAVSRMIGSSTKTTKASSEPKDYEWDDPDSPSYSDEVRSAAYTLARGHMNAYDDRLRRPRRAPDTPIRKGLLRKCVRDLYDADAFGLRSGARRP